MVQEESIVSDDAEQNLRIRDLESRLNTVENDLSAILARLDTLTSIGKGIVLLAGLALGVDVVPMMAVGA